MLLLPKTMPVFALLIYILCIQLFFMIVHAVTIYFFNNI